MLCKQEPLHTPQLRMRRAVVDSQTQSRHQFKPDAAPVLAWGNSLSVLLDSTGAEQIWLVIHLLEHGILQCKAREQARLLRFVELQQG